MILLDTDICVELLRGNKQIIKKRQKTQKDIAVSFMSIAELYYGIEKSQYPQKNRIVLEEFLLTVIILQSDLEILTKFGELKAELNQNNILLPDADIFIAATVLTKCSCLITGNTKHFKRFEEIQIENWIK